MDILRKRQLELQGGSLIASGGAELRDRRLAASKDLQAGRKSNTLTQPSKAVSQNESAGF
ncbi:MAG TPA: hypothetical protein VGH29_02110 [Candidatus Binataceae bacterium]|jgi:hypothetical protein